MTVLHRILGYSETHQRCPVLLHLHYHLSAHSLPFQREQHATPSPATTLSTTIQPTIPTHPLHKPHLPPPPSTSSQPPRPHPPILNSAHAPNPSNPHPTLLLHLNSQTQYPYHLRRTRRRLRAVDLQWCTFLGGGLFGGQQEIGRR